MTVELANSMDLAKSLLEDRLELGTYKGKNDC